MFFNASLSGLLASWIVLDVLCDGSLLRVTCRRVCRFPMLLADLVLDGFDIWALLPRRPGHPAPFIGLPASALTGGGVLHDGYPPNGVATDC
jgi:hypothetical protein